jgi:hypothetical protein
MKSVISAIFCFFVFNSFAQIVPSYNPIPIEINTRGNSGSNIISDTVQVQCGTQLYYDTSYTQRTTCEIITGKITHDSTYQNCSRYFFWTSCKTKTTRLTHDSSYQNCKNYTDTIITTTSLPKYCDSIIYSNKVKAPLSGLAIRQQTWFNSTNPDTAWLNAMGGNIVLRINLYNLWPSENTFDFSPIDSWIDWAKNLEAQGVPIHFKLRVISGTFAPQWLRIAAGAFPIDSTGFSSLPGSGIASDSCLKFWSEEAKAYNAVLQSTLAARYDTSRFISTVTITATGIGTGEPFEWATSSSGAGLNRRNQFIAAGATNANLQAAIASEIYADTVWKYTNIELCANPFQPVNPAANVSVPITETFIDQAAALYGTRLSIGNNGLRTTAAPDGAKWAAPSGSMYLLENYGLAKRSAFGTKQYNQTASESQMGGYGNLLSVLNAGAMTWKDILIELPDVEKKIKANLTNTQLKYYRDLLKANQ